MPYIEAYHDPPTQRFVVRVLVEEDDYKMLRDGELIIVDNMKMKTRFEVGLKKYYSEHSPTIIKP